MKSQLKIQVNNPLVEIDGDEMARIMWLTIKEKLIYPYLNLDIKYFDLSIQQRDKTNDSITIEAADAIKKYNVGVKCATITPDSNRVKEFNLSHMYKSPNATLRNRIGGTLFREPIIVDNISKPLVHTWKKPITIARHAYGDQYISVGSKVPLGSSVKLVIEKDGKEIETLNVHKFDKSSGICLAMHNTDEMIESFAHSCFVYAINNKKDLYLSTKNTVLKEYDGRFVDIFASVFELYKDQFSALNIKYMHKLIDDMVAYALRVEGGFIWACKNYDGDVQSDMLAQGFGSLGMMQSILANGKDKKYLSEAAHGTVTAHYRLRQNGQITSTNPVASIYSWICALDIIAMNENNDQLKVFLNNLRSSISYTMQNGNLTKDIALTVGPDNKWYTTEDFIDNIKNELDKRIS